MIPALRDGWRLTLALACLAAVDCGVPLERADALPLGSLAHVRVISEAVACRAPPWFRGLQDVAPFVCGTWWGWPRYYREEFGVRHHRHYPR